MDWLNGKTYLNNSQCYILHENGSTYLCISPPWDLNIHSLHECSQVLESLHSFFHDTKSEAVHWEKDAEDIIRRLAHVDCLCRSVWAQTVGAKQLGTKSIWTNHMGLSVGGGARHVQSLWAGLNRMTTDKDVSG